MIAACPNCKGRRFATDETLTGYADLVDDRIELEGGMPEYMHGGWTEVEYDSAETTGAHCLDCHSTWAFGDLIEVEEEEDA